ncbi:MAG: DUF2298 domain-containing protein [Chloroflexota bacterium]|nr:DUF2298 domain-containing protein [Chloroflexota bacterium]
MNQIAFAFRWYLVVQAFGLAALPLCRRLFRHLPDRGYGLSKPLGLLLAGWAFWLLTTFGWLHNTAGGVLAALALLAAAGLLLQLANQPTSQLPWRTVLVTELLLALVFAAWCVVRANMPRIETAGGEKWMEIAFLRAILRSTTFPPHDPWLSGFGISYYYFGYIIVAMLTRLASVPPSIAFNLGSATLFALACSGAFSLVYNLVMAEGRGARGRGDGGTRGQGDGETGGERVAILGGLLGPLLLVVMGNLEGLLEVLHARGIGLASFWQWLDVRSLNVAPPSFAEGSWVPSRFMWWWQASRVLHDYTPWGAEQEVIDEFPAFSFILGDMHPHVLALPFVLLALALALNLYLRIGRGGWRMEDGVSRFLRLPFASWEFFIYALCLGGLGFLNTWDFPIYLFVVAGAYTLAYLRIPNPENHETRNTKYISRFAFFFITFLLAGILLYLPFWLGFQSQAGGILPNLFNGTRVSHFVVMFGPLVLLAALFVADQGRRDGVRGRAVVRWTLVVALGILGVLACVLGLVLLLTWLDVLPPQGPITYLAAWLRGGPIPGLENIPAARSLVSSSLAARLLGPRVLEPAPFPLRIVIMVQSIMQSPFWTVIGLLALLTTIGIIIQKQNSPSSILHSPSSILHSLSSMRNFVLLLFATGALLVLSVEFVYLRDHFGTRMNTVFKFYFQAWVMWAIAGAYALVGFIRQGRVGVVASVTLFVVAGLIYPVLAIPARARDHGGPPTLDGAAYLAETQPDDYAGIAWLNENVAGAPVILETPGDRLRSYVYDGRVSAHTGLPTLLGWGGHEHQWRGDYDEPARREPDIDALYTSVDPHETLTLLDKYDISYVYVGPTERARYPAAGLAKFAQLMETVYDTGTVTIYYTDE